MEYETADGWTLDNIPPLQEFVDEYDNVAKEVYKLRNCVRTDTLVEMRDILLESLENMKMSLERIDDNDTVKESEEEMN